jgi:Heterodisulfide reductase, subunit B
MSSYLYYPGCSMEGSGRSYRESLEGICEPLGITFEEINDWNCCGATEYVSLSTTPAYAMIARNLAIAAGEKKGTEPLVAACSACYLNLAKTDHYMGQQPALNARINDALGAGGLHYDPGTIKVRHLLEVILTTSAWTRSKPRSRSLSPASRSHPTLAAWFPVRTWTAPTPTTSSRTISTACFGPSAPTSWTTRSRPSAAAAT